jgi:hypothetical protein
MRERSKQGVVKGLGRGIRARTRSFRAIGLVVSHTPATFARTGVMAHRESL